MRFLKIFGVDLLNLDKSEEVKKGKSSRNHTEEREKLQGMLNNLKDAPPLTDTASRSSISPRALEPEVQEAVSKFNKMNNEEKSEIIDLADSKLQEKLMGFMNQNAKITRRIEQNDLIIRNLPTLNNKEDLSEYKQKLKELADDCITIAEDITNAFANYKGINPADIENGALSDKANYTIGLSNRFKQTIASYAAKAESKLQTIAASQGSDVNSADLEDLESIVSKIKSEMAKYKNDTADTMNAFIPEVILSNNQFSAMVNKYANKGIPLNLNFENKDCENALIDALLEATNYSGAKIF